MSDWQKVLGWLQSGRPIDPATAWRELGVYRLSARIYDLRRMGYRIGMRRKHVVGRDGKRTTVAEYYMEAGDA